MIVELLRTRKHEIGAISIITLIEVLRGIKTEKRTEVKKLLEKSFNVLNINNTVVETYCGLYETLKKEGKLIPDADILIAATSIAYGLKLKTKDQHFKRLKTQGLKLE
jgi:predicted nucleic acid-binding protein